MSSDLERALSEFEKAWFSGEQPDPEEFSRRYPDFADSLQAQIENFLLVVQGLSDVEEDSRFEEPGAKDDDAPRLGDFRIIKEIGRGGMGVVYEARQVSLKRKVALKILPDHLSFSREAVLKFRREAEAGGRQQHPGIVAVYAVGEHEGCHYIAQELIEGGDTLADRLEELRAVGEPPIGYFRETALLVSDVANALQHAHDSGVIHRDIKPSNILITRKGTPKITDFGLAKVEDALALSRTGDLAGTPYYMSPEQASGSGSGIDLRTDIFSLGATLYESLTLKRPFEGKSSQEVLKKVVYSDPVDPRKLNPRIPHDLTVICLKAMDKESGRRYPTMGEMADDLRRYLQGEVILARSSGAMTRAVKRVKRYPAFSAAVGVAALALLLLILSIPWYILKITEERDKATDETIKLKAVNEFLQRILIAPATDLDGREVKVVEILEPAVEWIDETFADQPLIAAKVRSALGFSFLSLGLHSRAEELLIMSLETQEELLGEEDENTLDSMTNLAKARSEQGKYDEAEADLEKVLEIRRRVYSENHVDTLNAMNALVVTLKGQGRLTEALPICKECVELFQRTAGRETPETLNAMHNLGVIQDRLGQLDEAEAINIEILEIRRRILGEEHPDTLKSMLNLANLFQKKRDFARAESFQKQYIEIFTRTKGDEHPDTVLAMHNLALTYYYQKKHAEGEAMNRKVLQIRNRTIGKDHPETLRTMVNLGLCLTFQDKFDEANMYFDEAMDIQRRTYGVENDNTLEMMFCVAQVRRFQKRYDEAGKLGKEILSLQEKRLGADHPQTLQTINFLVQLYESWDKPEIAADYRAMLGEKSD